MKIILNGDASVASFNMDEKDIENFMKQDFITLDSDGSDGHPRKYGTFPKFFHEYVRDEARADDAAGGRSAAARTTAKILGLKDRGVIAPNNFADVIVFDPRDVRRQVDVRAADLLAVGMKYVLVNGVLAVDDGQVHRRDARGRVLKHHRVDVTSELSRRGSSTRLQALDCRHV